MPPILRERLIWQRMTRNTNTVKITAWGGGMYLERNKYSGWTISKRADLRPWKVYKTIHPHCRGRSQHLSESTSKGKRSETADNIRRSFNAQSWNRGIQRKGDRRIRGHQADKRCLERLERSVFCTNFIYNGERCAGWIYSRKQKVRETLAMYANA